MFRTMFLALLGAALVMPGAAQAAPGQLDGESFTGTVTVDTSSCREDSGAQLSFHAEGTATGPVSGPFTEDGSITSDDTINGNVTAFSATFTINGGSPTAVSGTKDLGSGSGSLFCFLTALQVDLTAVSYTTNKDDGLSDVQIDNSANPSFTESFTSNGTSQTPKQCRDAENKRHHDAEASENATHRANQQSEDAKHKSNNQQIKSLPADQRGDAQAAEDRRHRDAVKAENKRHRDALKAENAKHQANMKACKG